MIKTLPTRTKLLELATEVQQNLDDALDNTHVLAPDSILRRKLKEAKTKIDIMRKMLHSLLGRTDKEREVFLRDVGFSMMGMSDTQICEFAEVQWGIDFFKKEPDTQLKLELAEHLNNLFLWKHLQSDTRFFWQKVVDNDPSVKGIIYGDIYLDETTEG